MARTLVDLLVFIIKLIVWCERHDIVRRYLRLTEAFQRVHSLKLDIIHVFENRCEHLITFPGDPVA